MRDFLSTPRALGPKALAAWSSLALTALLASCAPPSADAPVVTLAYGKEATEVYFQKGETGKRQLLTCGAEEDGSDLCRDEDSDFSVAWGTADKQLRVYLVDAQGERRRLKCEFDEGAFGQVCR